MSIRDLLLIAEGTDTARGGQERSILELAAGLREAGCSIRWAAKREVAGPWSTEVVSITSRSRGAQTRQFLGAAEAIARSARPGSAVISFAPVRAADFYFPRGGVLPEALARSAISRGTRLGRWISRGSAIFDSRRRTLLAAERAALSDPSGPTLLALSDYVAESGRRHYGLAPSRIRVVRNGVDAKRLQPSGARSEIRRAQGLAESTTVLLAAAHNPRLKGVPELLESVHRLTSSEGWILLLIGRAGLRFRQHPRVKVLGARDDVADLLEAADVLVHPTYYDPSSRIVLEALSRGLPVITTRYNGASEDVQEAGIVLDSPSDPSALDSALKKAMDPEWRSNAREAARRIGPGLGVERQVRGVMKLLAEMSR